MESGADLEKDGGALIGHLLGDFGFGATIGTPEGVVSVTVTDQSLKDALKAAETWKKGDQVVADVSVETKAGVDTLTLMNLTPKVATLNWTVTVGTMLITLVVFGLVTQVLSSSKLPGVPTGALALLFVGQDSKVSNSKTQITLWFSLVIVIYVSAFCLRWWYGGFLGMIGIPANLLALTGLSALTFAGAKAITTQKLADPKAVADARSAADAKRQRPKPEPRRPRRQRRISQQRIPKRIRRWSTEK